MSNVETYYHPNEGDCIVTDDDGKQYHLTAIGADISNHKVKLASKDGPARPGEYNLNFPDGTPFVGKVRAGAECDIFTRGNIALSLVFDYRGTPYLVDRKLGDIALKHAQDYIWGVTRKEKSEELSFTEEVWTVMYAPSVMEPDTVVMTPANDTISVGVVEFAWGNT